MSTKEVQNIIEDALPFCPKERKFSFTSIEDVLQNIKPVEWLIEGYIEQETITSIFGEPASGKSFIAVDMACCIATGAKFHGHATKQGAVFYIAGEGQNGLGKRFKAWEKHTCISLKGKPLHISDKPAQLMNSNNLEDIKKAIQELVNKHGITPHMIIIDTLARNFGNGDENSAKDMSLFIQHLDQLKEQWKTSILIIHHTGHQSKGRARGSTSLNGALDHEFLVKKNDNLINMSNTKTKDSCPPSDIHFQTKNIKITPPSGDKIDSLVLEKLHIEEVSSMKKKLSKQQKTALDTFNQTIEKKGLERTIDQNGTNVLCLTMAEYIASLENNKITNSEKPDSIRRAVNRAIKELKEASILDANNDYIWKQDKADKDRQTK